MKPGDRAAYSLLPDLSPPPSPPDGPAFDATSSLWPGARSCGPSLPENAPPQNRRARAALAQSPPPAVPARRRSCCANQRDEIHRMRERGGQRQRGAVVRRCCEPLPFWECLAVRQLRHAPGGVNLEMRAELILRRQGGAVRPVQGRAEDIGGEQPRLVAIFHDELPVGGTHHLRRGEEQAAETAERADASNDLEVGGQRAEVGGRAEPGVSFEGLEELVERRVVGLRREAEGGEGDRRREVAAQLEGAQTEMRHARAPCHHLPRLQQ